MGKKKQGKDPGKTQGSSKEGEKGKCNTINVSLDNIRTTVNVTQYLIG